jgi:hypothetical protein
MRSSDLKKLLDIEGQMMAQLDHRAKNRKVAGLIPHDVPGIFYLLILVAALRPWG